VPRFLAIDWDQNQLHLVAATVSGRTVKVQRAIVWQEEQTPNPANAEELGQLLRQRLRDAGIKPAPLLVCVGRDRLIFKDVRLPVVPPDEEQALVRFQALKELSDAPDDVVIDHAPTPNREGTEQRVLAMVLRKELLNTYRQMAQGAGLVLACVAPRPMGIASCLTSVLGTSVLTPPPESADGALAVVVIGERWAEFQVLRNGQVLMARSLTPGANLASEIRRNLHVYNGQNSQHPVQAVYLAGKGMGDLRQQLGDLIETPIHPFDPFAGAEDIELPPAARGGFAGPVGLLKGRASGELKVNFAQLRQVQKPRKGPNRRILVAALLVVVVAGAATLYGINALGAAQARQVEIKTTLQDVDGRLTLARESAKKLKGLEDWDSVVWLDEFYDLTARIPDVNALRITTITAEPLPRTAKSRFVAAVMIRGLLLDRVQGRRPLDQLVDRFNTDGYYSIDSVHVERRQFALRVLVERRPPTEYTAVISSDAVRAKGKSKGTENEQADEEGSKGAKGKQRRAGN
jgi:Tfp pilus assembly PilM family ATPase